MSTRRGFLKRILSASAAVPLAALPQPKGDDPEVAALKARLAELEAAPKPDPRHPWSAQDLADLQTIWKPGRLLSPPPSAVWVNVVPTVSQYGQLMNVVDERNQTISAAGVYEFEEEIPDDD